MHKKFIITTDEKTAAAMIAAGFRLACRVTGTYTFVNEKPEKFSFDTIDTKKIAFTNILSL